MMKEWLNDYAKLKEQEKELKAKITETGGKIKDYLVANKLEEFSDNGYKITYKGSERITVVEERLITTLKKLARQNKDADTKKLIRACIKKVEAVDEHLLEELVYNGTIDSESLEPCYESKMVYTLRLSKSKK